jgi:TRAP-type transport system periplasmic protein
MAIAEEGRLVRWVIAAAGTVLLGSSTPALSETVLRIASYVPENSANAQAIRAWGDAVEGATAGKLRFQYFWSGALLSPADTVQGIRDGRADIGLVVAAYSPSRLPLSTVESIPFTTSNLRALSHAFADTYQSSAALQGEYAGSGLHMLLYAPADVNMFFSKVALNGIEDLKNKRIRAIGLGVPALEAVGASPVAIGANDIYESLSKGLLDAASGMTFDLGIDFGFHGVAPFIIDSNYGVYSGGSYAINKAVYDDLEPELRSVLDDMAAEFLDEFMLPAIQDATAARCQKALKAGATVLVWQKSETDKWREAVGDSLRTTWLESASATGADAKAFLAEFESRIRDNEQSMEWQSAGAFCKGQAG